MMLDLTALQRQAEAKYGLPVGMLASIMRAESGGDPMAVSKKGAMGLYQFMPATARELGIDPLDPAQATEGAGRYLSQLYDQTKDWPKALAAYNWGIGNVKEKGLAAAPEETQKYVPKVLGMLAKAEVSNPASRAVGLLSRQSQAQPAYAPAELTGSQEQAPVELAQSTEEPGTDVMGVLQSYLKKLESYRAQFTKPRRIV
jgi:hypothetical protein